MRNIAMESGIRSIEVNPAKLPMLFKKQFDLCNVKPGETIAIVSDLGTRREYIEAALLPQMRLGPIFTRCA